MLYIYTVDEYFTVCNVIKSYKKICKCAFSRSRMADNADHLALVRLEGNIVQYSLVTVVSEADVFELYLATGSGQGGGGVPLGIADGGLGGKYFPMLLEETRKVYDYVLVDTPPLGQVIDAAVLTPHCDGTLLVMESHSIRQKHARSLINQLERSGSKILGVVRNNIGESKKHRRQ